MFYPHEDCEVLTDLSVFFLVVALLVLQILHGLVGMVMLVDVYPFFLL